LKDVDELLPVLNTVLKTLLKRKECFKISFLPSADNSSKRQLSLSFSVQQNIPENAGKSIISSFNA